MKHSEVRNHKHGNHQREDEMKQNPEEKRCKAAFDEFLKQKETKTINWSPGDEPPDFYVHCYGKKFAVEVTSIMSQYTLAKQPISSIGVHKSLNNLLEDIKRQAKEQNCLHGAYQVRLQPIKDFSANKSIIEKRVLSYIERTKCKPYETEEMIFSPTGDRLCLIKKHHDEQNYIGGIIFDNLGQPWEGIIKEELTGLLNESLGNKVHKLRNIDEPIILLLWDDYHRATNFLWEEVVSSKDTNKFHTIARVFERDCQLYCQILQSEVEDWLLTE
jgi:hypothetical protein